VDVTAVLGSVVAAAGLAADGFLELPPPGGL